MCSLLNKSVAGDIIVLGLGNPLMSDEGIGCRIIECLLAQAEKFPSVDFVDAGTGGLSVLHLIANRKKAIIIDCAYMEMEPGAIKKFRPDEVKTIKKLAHLSLHETDIIKVINLAKMLGQYPKQLVIFGIEPHTIESQPALSNTLNAKINDYLTAIAEELSI
jgi:hydrogenase maturation protease